MMDFHQWQPERQGSSDRGASPTDMPAPDERGVPVWPIPTEPDVSPGGAPVVASPEGRGEPKGQVPEEMPDQPDADHLLGWCPVRESDRPLSVRDRRTVNLRALSVVDALASGESDEAWSLVPGCSAEADLITQALAQLCSDLVIIANPRDPSAVVAKLRTRVMRAQP